MTEEPQDKMLPLTKEERTLEKAIHKFAEKKLMRIQSRLPKHMSVVAAVDFMGRYEAKAPRTSFRVHIDIVDENLMTEREQTLAAIKAEQAVMEKEVREELEKAAADKGITVEEEADNRLREKAEAYEKKKEERSEKEAKPVKKKKGKKPEAKCSDSK